LFFNSPSLFIELEIGYDFIKSSFRSADSINRTIAELNGNTVPKDKEIVAYNRPFDALVGVKKLSAKEMQLRILRLSNALRIKFDLIEEDRYATVVHMPKNFFLGFLNVEVAADMSDELENKLNNALAQKSEY
jgi:hypothetical protein